MRNPVGRRLLAALFFCLPWAAQADEPSTAEGAALPAVSLHGFGTLGVSCFTTREMDFAYNTLPNGPGRTRRCDAGLDSRLGVQMDVQPVDALTASLQVVTQREVHSTFRPQVQLASVRWQVNEAWWLRLGRVNNPLFMESEYRLAHYALTGVRPPVEVYGLAPTYVMDGLDSRYHFVIAGWRAELYGGMHTYDIKARQGNSQGINVYPVRNIRTLTLSAAQGAWSFKAGYNTNRATFIEPRTEMLFGVLQSMQAGGLADDLRLSGTPVHILSLGARYDDNEWLVQSEVVLRDMQRSYVRNAWAGYLTVGRRFGIWMPYATIVQRRTSGRLSDPRTPAVLVRYVNELLAATRYDQHSLSLGLSREMGKGMLGKLQVQWIRPDKNAWGNSLTNYAPGFNPGEPAHGVLISANLDFIF